VSVRLDGTLYSIAIYCLGWYNPAGGHLMLSVRPQAGHAQGYYDQTTHRLVTCHSCTLDRSVGLADAHWQPSYMLTVPTS
jgi:hypothetical protein